MTKIKIRKFNADDLENVFNLFAEHINVAHERTWGFRRRFLLSYIFGKPFSLLGEDTLMGSIAETDEGYIIGTVFARRFPFGKSWVIGPVVVHSNFRGSGISTRMMNFTVGRLRKKKAKLAILSVETNNIQARRFFEKSDFEYLGPVFMNHDQARNYVQMLTLISGYLQNTTYKIEKYPLQTKNVYSNQKSRANGIRTWHIMLREL